MAPPLSDAVVVDVLRRVDRLTAPLVRRLGRPPELPQAERAEWWAERVSRVAAGVSAAPRLAGKLADLLPLQNTVGSAVQALVIGGVAAEHGVEDEAERVALLAAVLLDRDLSAERVRPLLARTRGAYADDVLGDKADRSAVRTLWRVARLLSRIDGTLDARPKGKLRHRALSNLPVVGTIGGYAAEREGLRRAAAETAALLADRAGRAPAAGPSGRPAGPAQ
ncbi:hypothetical protein SAMN05660350_01522 [Geodermatophilus obscurus]|uniref:Uncharacterized protein n=1 Tax=Geodermatophilus obscurus TaxID=1861 RepID=A0A1M7T9G7_9ACTN|nr:hypothetical protein [Geodermatophilus obscurus]SHN67394.1 hypothetical protein SAMN05660350_01522 [Geodermatophilus obscurus]